jgi:hypothetical protein
MRQFSTGRGTWLAAIVVLAAPAVAGAHNANYQMCAVQANTTWFPTIDGVMDTDPGWMDAFAYVPESVEAGTPDVQIWSNAQASGPFLNFAFKVTNDPTYDDTDTLIMAFDAGGGAFHRIHIKPVHASGNGIQGACPNGSFVPAAVEYWPGTNGVNGAVAWGTKQTFTDSTPAWMKACVTNSGATTTKTWTTEVQLTLGNAKLPLPLNTDIGVYVNAYRVFTDGMGVQSQTQYTWPAVNGTIFNVIENTPNPDTWGVGRILAADTSACHGLYLTSTIEAWNPGYGANIGTGHPGVISDTTQNHVSAIVYNDGPQATHVRATFFYFPWGSTKTWKPVPSGCTPEPCNNTNPGSTVAATNGQTTFLQTTGWIAPNTDAGHACIRVDLSSDVAGTTFKQRSAFNNFEIGAASRFEIKATINPGPPEEPGATAQKFLVTSSQQVQYAYGGGEISQIKAGTLTEQLTTTYRPYRISNKNYVLYGQAKQYFMDPYPAYGVAVQHAVAPAVQRMFEVRNQAVLAPSFLLDPVWSKIDSGAVTAITPKVVRDTRLRVIRGIRLIEGKRLKLPLEERRKLPPAAHEFAEWAAVTPAILAKAELVRLRALMLKRANVVLANIKDKPNARLWKTELPGVEVKRGDAGFRLESKGDKPIEVPVIIEHP